jgi:radical S-adenosyl methionine domain-containing protein 2
MEQQMTKSIDGKLQGIPALNFHVWQPCNMKCTYCFAHFDEARPYLKQEKALLRANALKVVAEAARVGIEKITFVGGEPLLCPWLGDLLASAKALGMVTMVVTNGSRLSECWMDRHGQSVDWFSVSIDSLTPETNCRIGRVVSGKPFGRPEYEALVECIRRQGKRLKINTVVSAYNIDEDFNGFIQEVQPERWKLFQVLPIHGQNDAGFPASAISAVQFVQFVARHAPARASTQLVAEDNQAMTGSYLMIDPAGRFFDNVAGIYRYSQPIWQVGWQRALQGVGAEYSRFVQRGGDYQWS